MLGDYEVEPCDLNDENEPHEPFSYGFERDQWEESTFAEEEEQDLEDDEEPYTHVVWNE